MRHQRALSSLAVLAFATTPAFANECDLNLFHNDQVASLKITVQNKSSDKLRIKLLESAKGNFVDVGKKKSVSRKIDIPKDENGSSNSVVKRSNHGALIEKWDQYQTGFPNQKILGLRLTVTNALTEEPKKKVLRRSTLSTAKLNKQKQFKNYRVTCNADFNGKGKNSWEHVITIKDK